MVRQIKRKVKKQSGYYVQLLLKEKGKIIKNQEMPLMKFVDETSLRSILVPSVSKLKFWHVLLFFKRIKKRIMFNETKIAHMCAIEARHNVYNVVKQLIDKDDRGRSK